MRNEVWTRANINNPHSSGKHLASAISLAMPASQLHEARVNIVRYYERLDKLYAKVVITGKGLFHEANHCRVDAIAFSSDSHNCLRSGDSKLAKDQDDTATTRARENIQRSIAILHDIYDTVMVDRKNLRDFEYLYGGGYAAFPALYGMATVNRSMEDEVKKLVQRWSSGEFETESVPLLEEVEGRWQTAEEQRTVIVYRRLSSGVDHGPGTVFESAQREIMNTPMPITIGNQKRAQSEAG